MDKVKDFKKKGDFKYKCPRCGKKSVWEGNKYRPFCSNRCKMIDLGEWADEKFKVSEEIVENGDGKVLYDEEYKEDL